MNIVEAKIIIIKLFVRSVIAFGIFAWIVEEILVVVIGFVWDIIACFVDWLDLVEDWLSLVVNCLIGVMVLVWFFETYLPLVVIVDLLFDVYCLVVRKEVLGGIVVVIFVVVVIGVKTIVANVVDEIGVVTIGVVSKSVVVVVEVVVVVIGVKTIVVVSTNVVDEIGVVTIGVVSSSVVVVEEVVVVVRSCVNII